MIVLRQAEEVSAWFLAFHHKRGDWWGERLIPGRFAHVSAFAFLAGADAWLALDFTPRTTARALVFPGAGFPPWLAQWTDGTSILKAEVRQKRGFRLPWGVTCVEAAKELVGSRSGALSPAGLWNDLVAEGATIVYDAFSPAAAARSGDRGAGPGRRDGPAAGCPVEP